MKELQCQNHARGWNNKKWRFPSLLTVNGRASFFPRKFPTCLMVSICNVFRQQSTLEARRIKRKLWNLHISKGHLSRYGPRFPISILLVSFSLSIFPTSPLSLSVRFSPYLSPSLFLCHTQQKRYTHRESNNSWRAALR